jgi:hypothetical protein
MNVHIREALRTISSGLKYLPVNVTTLPNNYYYPNAATDALRNRATALADINDAGGVPFKGVHVNADCTLKIIGVDGEPATFILTAGCWPYGGLGILKTGSTGASNIILLY